MSFVGGVGREHGPILVNWVKRDVSRTTDITRRLLLAGEVLQVCKDAGIIHDYLELKN